MKTMTKLWMAIGLLACLSPLGIIIPHIFNSGAAWGEWSTDEIQKMSGFVPIGMEKLSSIWKATITDYTFYGWETKGLGMLSWSYLLSAILGIIICLSLMYFIGKILTRKGA